MHAQWRPSPRTSYSLELASAAEFVSRTTLQPRSLTRITFIYLLLTPCQVQVRNSLRFLGFWAPFLGYPTGAAPPQKERGPAQTGREAHSQRPESERAQVFAKKGRPKVFQTSTGHENIII
jgi:hypothetical protein